MRTAGVTVLYNPDGSVIRNIASYMNAVERLYVVDNSDADNGENFAGDKICYIPNRENLGIAAALNIGAQKALEEGFDFLLTMDQDSRFENGGAEGLIGFLTKLADDSDLQNELGCTVYDLGLVSPLHKTGIELGITYSGIDSPDTVMTSGNIISLSAYEKIGGFKDWMFIDAVDFDYCLNLRRHGFKILRLTDIELKHKVGDMITGKFFGKTVYSLNHSPMRRYYIVRNRHYFYDMYKSDFPEYCTAELRRTLPEAVKIILFEKQKTKKLLAMLEGYRDYKKGIKGKRPQ